jgi:hypothetical protein
MSALRTYVDYLIALSKEEQQEPPTIRDLSVKDPENFAQAFFRLLDKQEKTTRRGVDAATEALFTNPAMAPMLDDVTAITFQRRFVIEQMPLCTPLFRNYWSHVITPAWEQLRDLRRMVNYTSPDPDPNQNTNPYQ